MEEQNKRMGQSGSDGLYPGGQRTAISQPVAFLRRWWSSFWWLCSPLAVSSSCLLLCPRFLANTIIIIISHSQIPLVHENRRNWIELNTLRIKRSSLPCHTFHTSLNSPPPPLHGGLGEGRRGGDSMGIRRSERMEQERPHNGDSNLNLSLHRWYQGMIISSVVVPSFQSFSTPISTSCSGNCSRLSI